jgi:hypothetical protein
MVHIKTYKTFVKDEPDSDNYITKIIDEFDRIELEQGHDNAIKAMVDAMYDVTQNCGVEC